MHLLFFLAHAIKDSIFLDEYLTVILIGINSCTPDTAAFGKLFQAVDSFFQSGYHFICRFGFGNGMKVETSNDNSTWTAYDGSTRTKYMRAAVDLDQAAADEVAAMIEALPAEITADDTEAVEAARAAYDALTDEQKALVNADILAKLDAAEEALIPELVNDSEIATTDPTVGEKVRVVGAASGGAGLSDLFQKRACRYSKSRSRGRSSHKRSANYQRVGL